MTRFIRVAVASFVMFTCATAGTDPFPPIEGTTPPSSVTHWIKYLVLGPSNAPFPIVVISTQRFNTHRTEALIVLSPSRYDIVANFTESRSTECMRPTGFPWFTLGINKHDEERTSMCAIPKATACGYLLDLSKLSGMNWTKAELKPLKTLAASMECPHKRYSDGKPSS